MILLGATSPIPPSGSVTLAMMADLAADRILGRADGAGTGVPQALTAAQVAAILSAGAVGFTGLAATGFRDTSAAFDVTLGFTSSPILSAARALTINVGNAAQSLIFTAASTITFPTGTQTLIGTNGNAFLGSGSLFVDGGTGDTTFYFDGKVGFGTTGATNVAPEAFFKRKAAAAIQMGADAAGVTNQMFTAASRITSDGVGANLTLAAGNGRGAAAGSLILSSWTTEATGVVGALTTIATVAIGGFVVASGKKLTLGNAAVTGLTPAVLAAAINATIVITDSTGQDYRVPCVI